MDEVAPCCVSIRSFGTRPWLDYSSSLHHGCNLEDCFILYVTSLKSSHRPPSPVHLSSLMFPNLFLAMKHIENNRVCIQKKVWVFNGMIKSLVINVACSSSPLPGNQGLRPRVPTLYSELVPLAILGAFQKSPC